MKQDPEVEYVMAPVSLIHRLIAMIDGGRAGADEERELRALLEPIADSEAEPE